MVPTWPAAMTPASTMHSSPVLPTHICHWQNCHRVFSSMPDLLGHVASDHLGAPGFTAPPPVQQPQQLAIPTSTPIPDLDSLIFPSQTQAEADHLLSCLWDDCFPLPECTATIPEACPTHQTHTHNTTTGEPFSPQTMLRHVLEEHLGVPGEIIGWGPEDSIPSLPAVPAPKDAENKPNSNGHHHHHLYLPTPSPSSPSPPPAKPLICLWPGCNQSSVFADASSLMWHLSEAHIGKGKETYICSWDGCGGPHGRLFRSRQKVLRHLQSHTGHRPFVCEVCEQAFSEAAPLAAHMRRHAQESKCPNPHEVAANGRSRTFCM